MPPTLYNAGFGHVLWVTCDVIWGGFGNMLENAVAKRLKVPPAYRRQAVKIFQHTQLPFDSFFSRNRIEARADIDRELPTCTPTISTAGS